MTIANTLTGLQGQLYSAVDIVSRELIGFIPSVSLNASASRAAKDEAVKVPVSTVTSGVDITPAMTAPEPANKTVGTRSITITKNRAYPFGYTGEERLGLDAGVGYVSTQTQEIAQAIRGITNEMENDIAAIALSASRAYGAGGTTPFASNLIDTANVRKILADNGAPVDAGWRLVIDTTAGAKMRTLTQLTKVNEAADMTMLRQGTLLDIHGGLIRESAKIQSHTKGDGTGFLSDLGATLPIGSTTIHVDTGTEEIKAGDNVTFAGDANIYIVATGHDAGGGATEGDIVIAEPGLRQTLADGVAMTIGNSYSGNVGFTPDAIQLAFRRPALPEGGDMAVNRMSITDPRSGITFEFAEYKGYYQTRFEVAGAWGVDMTKPEHAALLLG